MNKTLKYCIITAALSFLAALVVIKGCNSNSQQLQTQEVRTQTDSTPFFLSIPYPVVRFENIKGDRWDSIIHDTAYLPKLCDSIAQDWVLERIYIDTLKNDSDAFICLNSVVRMNNLEDLGIEFKNRRKTQIITNNYYNEKTAFYGGLEVSRNWTGSFGFGINGSIKFQTFIIGGGIRTDGYYVLIQKKINFKN